MTRSVSILFLFLALPVLADDAFPVSRRTGLGTGATTNTWYDVGIPGGIPFLTTISSNLSAGSTLAQINAAIAAAPSNSVVTLAAGNYNLGGTILMTKDGVVLRGATNANGLPTTMISNARVATVPYWGPESGGGGFPSVASRNISSGLTEGSTSVTLATAPNADFAVGAVFVIDQTDIPGTVYPDNHSPAMYTRSGRSYCMPVYCTNISGNTLQFTPPLIGTYWSSSRSPQAYGWNSVYGASRKRAGLENVDISSSSANEYGDETVKFQSAYQCWIKNVRIKLDGYGALSLAWAVNSEIQHCIVRDTVGNGSANYATVLVINSCCRCEDNIYMNLSLAITSSSMVGNSISFNYVAGPYPYSTASWLAECIFPHGGHPHHCLFEGNWSGGPLQIDHLWGGNNSTMGVVRNRWLGYYPGKSGNCTPIVLEEYTFDTTIIGNSLGDSRYHTSYSQMVNSFSGVTGTIKTNNYNTVNDGVNPAETLSAGSTVAESYTYASRPGWFGDRTWPAFGPQAYNANAYTNIPAGYRAYYGTDVLNGTPNTNPPAITADPIGVTNSATAGFMVTVSASGSGLAYQWQRSATNLPGATGASYSKVPATTNDNGSYRVTITNAYGSVTSAAVSVMITNDTSTYIWPLGDSLTRGGSSAGDTNYINGGYRLPLYQLFTNAGSNVKFVGTLSDNSTGMPYPAHDGHPGYRIAQLASGVPTWAAQITAPHYTLIQCGINDAKNNDAVTTMTNRLISLLNAVCTNLPSTKVIIAIMNPWDALAVTNAALNTWFNNYVPSICSNQVALGRQVSYVDMRQPVIVASDVMADTVHLQASGYNKMATNFYSAIGIAPPTHVRISNVRIGGKARINQ